MVKIHSKVIKLKKKKRKKEMDKLYGHKAKNNDELKVFEHKYGQSN